MNSPSGKRNGGKRNGGKRNGRRARVARKGRGGNKGGGKREGQNQIDMRDVDRIGETQY